MTRLVPVVVSAVLAVSSAACGPPAARPQAPGVARPIAAPGGRCQAALGVRGALHLDRPRALAIDGGCDLFVADLQGNRVLRITPTGAVSVLAGGGGGRAVDGAPAAQARIGRPQALAVDAAGNVYIGTDEARVLRVSPDGLLRTAAGTGRCTPDAPPAGPGPQAVVCQPAALAVDAGGGLLIADAGNRYLSRLSPDGTVTTVAGNGERRSVGNGLPATTVAIGDPAGLAVGGGGVVFWSDGYSGSVRAVNADGTTSTVVTGGVIPPAEAAAYLFPQGLALDAAGALYVADDVNSRVWRLSRDGLLLSGAGTGRPGRPGDNGPAVLATLKLPRAIAFDPSGNLYIADTGGDRVRRVSPSGTISTVG